MNGDDESYHRSRAQHCRAMAETAADPDVRRRHYELAELHSGRAAHALASARAAEASGA